MSCWKKTGKVCFWKSHWSNAYSCTSHCSNFRKEKRNIIPYQGTTS